MRCGYLLLILSLWAFVVGPNFAYAQRQYRCAGRVQYRPCESPGSAMRGAPRAQARLRAPDARPYARVVSHEFSRLGGRDGFWRGMVEGNGLVALQLDMMRAGKLVERRYMGAVPLTHGSSTFAFRTRLPPGTGWEFRVYASAS